VTAGVSAAPSISNVHSDGQGIIKVLRRVKNPLEFSEDLQPARMNLRLRQ